jgi:hypothetical protein
MWAVGLLCAVGRNVKLDSFATQKLVETIKSLVNK